MSTKTYFVDTSALFKRYLPETGSERMDSLFHEDADALVKSASWSQAMRTLRATEG